MYGPYIPLYYDIILTFKFYVYKHLDLFYEFHERTYYLLVAESCER